MRIVIIVIFLTFLMLFELNIEHKFKDKEINGIKIHLGGVQNGTKKIIIIGKEYLFYIVKSKIDTEEFRIKKMELIQDKKIRKINIKKLIGYDELLYKQMNMALEEEYESEYIDLKHEDFILKLEYQIKTKDKIIDGKIETKMEYERKIYLTCPLWDAMMGI